MEVTLPASMNEFNEFINSTSTTNPNFNELLSKYIKTKSLSNANLLLWISIQIKRDISGISSKTDILNLLKLVNTFKILKQNSGKSASFIEVDKAKEIFASLIEKTRNIQIEYIAIHSNMESAAIDKPSKELIDKQNEQSSKINFIEKKIHAITSFIIEFHKIFPAELSQVLSEGGVLLKEMIDCFSNSPIMREFIYLYVNSNHDKNYSILKDEIGRLLKQIEELLKTENYDILVNELITISKLFVPEFSSLPPGFNEVIDAFLFKYKPHKYDFNIQLLFSELTLLGRKEIESSSFEIFNLMLRLYEEHLDNEEIGKAIIYQFFDQITIEQYLRLRDGSDFIAKYLKQLHKQKNQEIVSYFLEWIKQFSFEDEHVVSFDPSMEFGLIIENFPHFDDNIPILLFIHRQIKTLIQKDAFALLFINQPQLFKVIKEIVNKKGPTAKYFLLFIEDLLNLNLYAEIFQKAIEAQLFSFETFVYHDEIRYQAIKLLLFFESDDELFSSRINENIDGLFKLLSQLKTDEEHFKDNCEEIIDVLSIILESLSKGKTDVYNMINRTIFDNILKLIDDFTNALIEAEKKMLYIFRLWNNLFCFMRDINKSLMVKKLQPDDNRQLINKSPQFLTEAVIEKFIISGLMNYQHERAKMFLRYLYEKCIDFNLKDEDFNPIDANYDPIHCLILKYPNSKEMECKTQDKTVDNHSFIFIQSQLLLKCMMNAISKVENNEIKLSFIDYLDYLCSISQFNASLMLQAGILKSLIELFFSSPQIRSEKVVSLLAKLLAYAPKPELEHFFKLIYNHLIIKKDIAIATDLLNILQKSLQATRERIYVTLSKLETHHPQIYKFVHFDKTLTLSVNIFISLYTESFNCLYNFTLCKVCKVSKPDSSFSIELTKGKVYFFKNKSLQLSVPLNSQGKNLKKTWYNFLIEKGDNYGVALDRNTFIITFPESIDAELFAVEEKEEQCLDFSMGFINLPSSDTAESRINIETYYVDVSYALLSKEKITKETIESIEANKITTSMNGSVMQLNPKFTPTNISTEVLFSKVQLAKVKLLHSLTYKMTNQFNFDLMNTEVIPTIACNDTRNHDNVLYLLKPSNLIDFAAMNMICDINLFNKSLIVSNLFPFFTSLDVTINNVYFAEMFYIFLSQTDFFIQFYKQIINIILSNGAFQKMFIRTYIHDLKILFYLHSSELKTDFSGLMTIHNMIPIQEELQDGAIIHIYLDPFLFTSLTLAVQKELLKKIYLIVNNYSCAQVVNYAKIRKILTRFMDVLIFFEMDCSILGEIKEIIDEIFNVFINLGGAELDMTLSLGKSYLMTMAIFFKYKAQINNLTTLRGINIESIQSQMDILESYLKIALINKSSSISCSDDVGYIAVFFKIEFSFFKRYLKFDKRNKRIQKHLRLLWPEFFTDYKQYSWSLSTREGYSRMRKKFVLKENDMAIKEAKENKYAELSNKIEEYMKYWVWFERFSVYDSYSCQLLVSSMVCSQDRYQTCYLCLVFKNNEATESLLILGEKHIYIFYNIIIDKNKRIYLSKLQSSHLFWARDNNDKEWDELVRSNETKQSTINEFNYQSSQIKIKQIAYNQISELHKRRHLHQNNSIELFTLKGSSYFITVFPKLRDDLFNKVMNNINERSANSRIKNINKASSQTALYLKHHPIIITSIKDKDKLESSSMEKSIVDGKALAADISEKWAQYHISNFNYLMLINTLAGRSYNDLTQYFVFPWMLKNFFTERLDVRNEESYRDFSFPLHAQCKEDREKKRKDYEMKVMDEKIAKEQFEKRQAENKKSGIISKVQKYESLPIFHSGNYYSHFSFVCYFMLRLSPFSSIGLSVKGTFSQGDRLFNSFEYISTLSKRYQEWIPELLYLPEMLINMNDYELGMMTTKNEKKNVNDIVVPPWAKCDPRLMPAEMNRVLENSKISEQLNNWIDLIFGYKLIGKECIEAINMFNEGCYPYEDLKEKKMTNEELQGRLDTTSNLGCCPTQLFLKAHIQRKPFNPGKLVPFYEKSGILISIQPQNSVKQVYIKSKSIGDMKALYETPKYNTSRGEGGLTSLSFTTDVFAEDSFDRDAKEKRNYFVAGSKKCLLGPKFSLLLSYSVSSLFITNPVNSVVYEFPLMEMNAIKAVRASIDGKYIIVGLENGNVIKYRKRTRHNEALNFPFQEITRAKSSKMNVYPDNQQSNHSIFYNYKDLTYKSCDYWESYPSPPSAKNPLKKSLKVYSLIEDDRSGLPTNAITKMDLCESYSFFLVVDRSNNVYHFDFNFLKLTYKYQFNDIAKTTYSIKFVKIIHKTADYILGTKSSVHLFSINGLPLAFFNMFNQEPTEMFPITACDAVALNDTFIFTGHSNGNLIVWKLKTEAVKEQDANAQPLFEAFHQRYRNSFKEKQYSGVFAQRKFEIKAVFNKNQLRIVYIKISDDLLRLYYIDIDANSVLKIVRLSADSFFKDEDGLKLKRNHTAQFQSKIICKKCKKPLSSDFEICAGEDLCDCPTLLNSKFKTSD